MCVCVCVCERERAGGWGGGAQFQGVMPAGSSLKSLTQNGIKLCDSNSPLLSLH